MSLTADTQALPSNPGGTELPGTRSARGLRFVRGWLWCLAALVFAMVVVGGATRLTGSGLSITEWKPVTGAIPPLSQAGWLAEFEKYQLSPQYELLNKGMSLAEFQFIYWWEWSHRQLGRFIGFVYILGLLWTFARRLVDRRTGVLLFGMGCLLGLQGVIGWIMVASGLKEGMTAVAPVKLTLHLTFASFFFASLFAMLARLGAFGAAHDAKISPRAKGWALMLLAAVFVQIALGGLVAGSKAGLIFNTWPLMDGRFVPPAASLFAASPWFENFVDNVTLVQFNHRLGAYLLLALAFAQAFVLAREGGTGRRAAVFALLVLGQAALGIVTLILAVPLWAGLAHQAYAMVILAVATVHASVSARSALKSAPSRACRDPLP